MEGNELPRPGENPDRTRAKEAEAFTANDAGNTELTPLTVAGDNALGHVPRAYAENRPIEAGESGDPIGEVPSPAEIQEALLIGRAYEQAGWSMDAKAYVSERAADGDPLKRAIFEDAAARYEAGEERNSPALVRIFNEQSHDSHDKDAWPLAVSTASKYGATYQKRGMVHLLSTLPPGVTAESRLDEIESEGLSAYSKPARGQILRAVATQRAAIGDIDGAYRTTWNMKIAGAPPGEIEEAQLGIVDYLASQDAGYDGISSVTAQAADGLSSAIKTWAAVKVAAHMDGSEQTLRWAYTNVALDDQWRSYTPRQCAEIIGDLQVAGQYGTAARHALDMAGPGGGRFGNMEFAAIALDVATLQSAGDEHAGAATVAALEKIVDKQALVLSTVHRNPEPSISVERIAAMEKERHAFLGRIAGHKIGVSYAALDPEWALEQLDETRQHFKDIGKGREPGHYAAAELARNLASRGYTDKAAKAIETIGWYPQSNPIKSEALADVAQIARWRRIAIAGGESAFGA